MSERFVRGWVVSPEKLLALVGSGRLGAKEVLESAANRKCIEDVLMTLGNGDEEKGREVAAGALSAIFAGTLERERVYRYARVTEPLLNHVARPLATEYADGWSEPSDQIVLQLTYAVPNDSHGRWNPLLEAAGLPKLAATWAAPTFDFPWRAEDAPDRGRWPWPVWTMLSPSTLREVASELSSLNEQRIHALADDLVADDLVDDPSWAKDCRDELFHGLERLRTWVAYASEPQHDDAFALAPEGNSLVLLMDGDQ